MAYCRAIHKTVLKHFQLHGLIAFRFAFLFSQGLMRVKWDFVLILALASNNLSVFSPQGPTEGCGVIPSRGTACAQTQILGDTMPQGSL